MVHDLGLNEVFRARDDATVFVVPTKAIQGISLLLMLTPWSEVRGASRVNELKLVASTSV